MNDFFDDMNMDTDFLNEIYQNELRRLSSRYDEDGALISSDDEEKDKALVHRMIALKRKLRDDDLQTRRGEPQSSPFCISQNEFFDIE